jgi:hypothetical protein
MRDSGKPTGRVKSSKPVQRLKKREIAELQNSVLGLVNTLATLQDQLQGLRDIVVRNEEKLGQLESTKQFHLKAVVNLLLLGGGVLFTKVPDLLKMVASWGLQLPINAQSVHQDAMLLAIPDTFNKQN